MTSNRVSAKVRAYMKSHPGTKYQQALAAVTSGVSAPVPSLVEWMSVLGITDIETFDTKHFVRLWEANENTDSLNFPLGKVCDTEYVPTDETLFLDISEMSCGGTGAHGLLQGRTGSGKSVLLNNTVSSLSALYSPSKVNFALVDFKGGYTFKGLDGLPHVLAHIPVHYTSKAQVLQSALISEIRRREELLSRNRARDINEYRNQHSNSTPLPHLVFVVDDYHEFMAMSREYLKLFTDIGRKGRSLGIHLLISAQRADPSLLLDVIPHLTYAISLGAGPEDVTRDVMFRGRYEDFPPVTRRALGRGQGLVRYFNANHEEVITAFQALKLDEDSTQVLVRKLSEHSVPDSPERDMWREAVNSIQE